MRFSDSTGYIRELGGPLSPLELAHQFCREANRLYGLAGSDGGFQHAFMNPFMVTLARHLVRASQRVRRSSNSSGRS